MRDVAQRRNERTSRRLAQHSFRQVHPTQDVLGVVVESAEFRVCGLNQHAVDEVALGPNQISQGTNRNVEASKPGEFKRVWMEVDFSENVGVDIGAVEERQDLWLGHEQNGTIDLNYYDLELTGKGLSYHFATKRGCPYASQDTKRGALCRSQ